MAGVKQGKKALTWSNWFRDYHGIPPEVSDAAVIEEHLNEDLGKAYTAARYLEVAGRTPEEVWEELSGDQQQAILDEVGGDTPDDRLAALKTYADELDGVSFPDEEADYAQTFRDLLEKEVERVRALVDHLEGSGNMPTLRLDNDEIVIDT
jgi:hypothetical protein